MLLVRKVDEELRKVSYRGYGNTSSNNNGHRDNNSHKEINRNSGKTRSKISKQRTWKKPSFIVRHNNNKIKLEYLSYPPLSMKMNIMKTIIH